MKQDYSFNTSGIALLVVFTQVRAKNIKFVLVSLATSSCIRVVTKSYTK
jgi:hypothetical protein